MSVPNQNFIFIQRQSDKATKNFFKIGHTELNKAAVDLDGKAFKLYIYLCDNKDGYKKEMYPADFCRWSALSDSSYRRAFKELLEKGYLIKSSQQNNLYLFQEESKTFDLRNKPPQND